MLSVRVSYKQYSSSTRTAWFVPTASTVQISVSSGPLADFNTLQPSGHYMYRQFTIQHFYVLPTQCIYVFCVDLRTNSDYFPIQH